MLFIILILMPTAFKSTLFEGSFDLLTIFRRWRCESQSLTERAKKHDVCKNTCVYAHVFTCEIECKMQSKAIYQTAIHCAMWSFEQSACNRLIALTLEQIELMSLNLNLSNTTKSLTISPVFTPPSLFTTYVS